MLQNIYLDETPTKVKSKKKKRTSKSAISDESDAYVVSAASSTESEHVVLYPTPPRERDVQEDPAQARHPSSLIAANPTACNNSLPNFSSKIDKNPAVHQTEGICGLCGSAHSGPCYMTDSSENLAEYRRMLMFDAVDEPLEERVWL
jgi:chromodomain-helicase-DNA-binding protein 4